MTGSQFGIYETSADREQTDYNIINYYKNDK